MENRTRWDKEANRDMIILDAKHQRKFRLASQ